MSEVNITIEDVIRENQRLRAELEGATIATVLLLQRLGGRVVFDQQDLIKADDANLRIVSSNTPTGEVVIEIEGTGLIVP